MKTPVSAEEEVNTEPRVKLIKKKKSKVARIPPQVQSPAGETRWSTAIQLWVSEFQKRRVESLRGFNSLFK
ncbi:MAG TPA: hypothetical protein VIG25_18775 [Pyrinomonadaceae bacterium]|jgi:hypothetical protein